MSQKQTTDENETYVIVGRQKPPTMYAAVVFTGIILVTILLVMNVFGIELPNWLVDTMRETEAYR